MSASAVRVALSVAMVVIIAGGCARGPAASAPSPDRVSYASAEELAVYRTVAESIYVATTVGRIAVTRTVMDSTCAGPRCLPASAVAPHREGPPGATGSSVQRSSEEWRARPAGVMVLDGIDADAPRLVVIDDADVPLASADTSTWRYFRGNYGGVAGAVRFSPVAFSASGNGASVSVVWRCGPSCGHALQVALRRTRSGGWEIVDILMAAPEARPVGEGG